MQKPEIDAPEGPAPSELVITDIVVGEGSEAVAGGNVEVHYLGVDYDTGEEFDSSWSRGDTIRFPLNNLIQAWREGIPGMKVGGRRQLVCPLEVDTRCPGRRWFSSSTSSLSARGGAPRR